MLVDHSSAFLEEQGRLIQKKSLSCPCLRVDFKENGVSDEALQNFLDSVR